jgi:hypothetical protein
MIPAYKDWYEWIESDETSAKEYRSRIAAGLANPENPQLAAHLAFDAGVNAGIVLAAERLLKVMQGR